MEKIGKMACFIVNLLLAIAIPAWALWCMLGWFGPFVGLPVLSFKQCIALGMILAVVRPRMPREGESPSWSHTFACLITVYPFLVGIGWVVHKVML